MAKEVILPKFGFTHEESQIVQWLKHEGEEVEKGDPIVEVTTDKINMEVESPETGILAGVRAGEGDTMAATEILAYIVQPGEEPPSAPPPVRQAPSSAGVDAPASTTEERVETKPDGHERATPIAARLAAERGVDLDGLKGSGPRGRITRRDVEAVPDTMGGKVRATPAARRLADERQVDLAALQGSGPRARIQATDVLAASPATAAASATSAPKALPEVIPLAGMRATIAERMAFSFQHAPHFTLQVDVDATRLEALRATFNERSEARISATAILVKASAWALTRHPLVNASLVDQSIHVHKEVNIGVAVALDEGLIVPVVHEAHIKGIAVIAAEIRGLAERAQAGRLSQSDLSGGTFTVSNLGMFGIDRFTAIINPPESAILAVGRIERRAVPADTASQAIVVKPMMTLTLSVDHRVLDGASGARFLDDLRQGLEEPGWILY